MIRPPSIWSRTQPNPAMDKGGEWRELATRLARDLTRIDAGRGASRDEALWEELDNRLRSRLYRARAFRRLSPHDQDDALQTVLLKFSSPAVLAQLASAESPESFVVSIIRNQALDLLRKRLRESRLTDRLRAFPSPPLSVQPHLETDPRSEALRRAVSCLSESERQLLHWRFVADLSIVEIANRVGEPYSRVAVRLFRLLRRLRSMMDDAEPVKLPAPEAS